LLARIEQIVDPATRGDPMKRLRWVSKSLPHIVNELSRQGYRVSTHTVSKILQEDLDYGMQGLRKTREGSSHPDRDAQFHYINQQSGEFQQRGQPVISVDFSRFSPRPVRRNPTSELPTVRELMTISALRGPMLLSLCKPSISAVAGY
jgi:hypothetical protein